jgi:hypothetical protein
VESRPEKVGGGCKLAIHGLDPGIPAEMTAQWVLPCVLIIAASTIVIADQSANDAMIE